MAVASFCSLRKLTLKTLPLWQTRRHIAGMVLIRVYLFLFVVAGCGTNNVEDGCENTPLRSR